VQGQGNAGIDSALTNATDYIRAGTSGAATSLGSGYNTATGAVDSGYGATQGYYSQGQGYLGQGQNYLNQGQGNAIGALGTSRDAAIGAYAPLSALGTKYGGATSLALGALGVNGQAGTDAARSAFSAGPAYNFNLDQGLEAINRRRAAGGMLASGNADRDAQQYGAGLASNEYDKWLTNLLGFTNPELSATSGAASGIAGANQNYGNQAAGVYGNTAAGLAGLSGQQAGIAGQQAAAAGTRGAMLSDLASRYGQNVAGLQSAEGNSLANLQTGAQGQRLGLATNLAQPYSQTYGQEAAAKQQGSANAWKAGIEVAKLAAGAAAGVPTGGSSVGTLGATSGNWAEPYYASQYGTPDKLFPSYKGG
jgi:hypothetical protein